MKQKLTITALILLILAAFFYNLNKEPLIEDEALRGLVAMEMDYSGDLITPTTAGDHYFRKPPLYNWIILGFFKITGSKSEFVLRLPMVLSLLGFAGTLFLYLKRRFSVRTALLAALILLTNGRILFYESLHGLIDITFSWVVFFQIVCLYEFYRQEKYKQMFLVSYALAAVGFMLKGLPVIPFQLITLVVVITMHRSPKTLINRWHFFGIGLFLVLVGSYFYAYYLQNPDQTATYLSTLLLQSSSRTIFASSLTEGGIHIVTYPFKVIYHFLPWSVFGILFFSRKVRKTIRADRRQWFFLLAFFFNILVYWLSPEVYPRYILMLIPLGLIPMADQYLNREIPFARKFSSWFEWIISGIFILAIPATMTFNFLKVFHEEDGLLVKTLAGIALLTFLMFRYFKKEQFRVFIIGIILLAGRVGYNALITPERHQSEANKVVDASREIIDEVGEESLYTFYDPRKDKLNYHGRLKHKYEAHYYLQRYKGEMVPVKTKFENDGFYLVSRKHMKYLPVDVFGRYKYHQDYRTRYLVKKEKKFAF